MDGTPSTADVTSNNVTSNNVMSNNVTSNNDAQSETTHFKWTDQEIRLS